jgi:hypothetical protein
MAFPACWPSLFEVVAFVVSPRSSVGLIVNHFTNISHLRSSVLARLVIKKTLTLFSTTPSCGVLEGRDFRHPSLKLPSHHVKLTISTKPGRKKNDRQVTETSFVRPGPSKAPYL